MASISRVLGVGLDRRQQLRCVPAFARFMGHDGSARVSHNPYTATSELRASDCSYCSICPVNTAPIRSAFLWHFAHASRSDQQEAVCLVPRKERSERHPIFDILSILWCGAVPERQQELLCGLAQSVKFGCHRVICATSNLQVCFALSI